MLHQTRDRAISRMRREKVVVRATWKTRSSSVEEARPYRPCRSTRRGSWATSTISRRSPIGSGSLSSRVAHRTYSPTARESLSRRSTAVRRAVRRNRGTQAGFALGRAHWGWRCSQVPRLTLEHHVCPYRFGRSLLCVHCAHLAHNIYRLARR